MCIYGGRLNNTNFHSFLWVVLSVKKKLYINKVNLLLDFWLILKVAEPIKLLNTSILFLVILLIYTKFLLNKLLKDIPVTFLLFFFFFVQTWDSIQFTIRVMKIPSSILSTKL